MITGNTHERPHDGERPTVAHVVMTHHIGGLERVVMNLITGVDRDRYRTVLCCIEREADWVPEIRAACDTVAVFQKRTGISCSLPFRLARFYRDRRVDLVHCHNFGAYLYGALGARIASRRAIVYTIHGPDVLSDRLRALVHRMPLAHRVVAVSEEIRRGALERVGMSPKRLVTIVNGVSVENGGPSGRARPMGVGVGGSEDRPIIGCIARLTPEKDHDTLLRAFAQALLVLPRAKLLLVGDGPSRASLETLAGDLHLMESVRFFGTRQDVQDILDALDVFVLSSREEGLPVALLEAMAAGLPVVATSVGGIPDAIIDEETGLLVPPGTPRALAEAMIRLATDPEFAARLGAGAQKRVGERFSSRAMLDAYQELYDELLRNRGRQAADDQGAR